MGRHTSIRADEGAPIMIGNNADIEDRVTFHALKGTNIRIGKDLNTGDNIVFHGPLTVGEDLTIGDACHPVQVKADALRTQRSIY